MATIEHLLGALVGLNVDNVLVEVDGEEIPILDGSALGFVYLLGSAGLRSLNIPREGSKDCPAAGVQPGWKAYCRVPLQWVAY